MSIAQEPPANAKYEAFLDARLNQARQQVRWLDIAVGAVGLIALTIGYGLVMVILDRELQLPTFARQITLAGFVAFAVWYVMRVLVTPIRTAVNPYYAAKKVEHVLPQAKNSLVSWLDLRDRPLAEPIRDAIGRKAATDMSHANVTEAVRDTRLVRSGVILTVLALAALITLLALRPPQFFSLLQRAFLPFNGTAIATRTVIKLLKPQGGDATLSVNQSLVVQVEVDGRNPKAEDADAMRLKMRYQPSDPWEERKLEATDRAGEWRIQVPAATVRTGFEYQVVGGDAETPIYRVRVRAKAMITDFEVTYKYRPYLGFADDVRADPNLSAYRGTTVTLLAKTNRPVKDGALKFVPAAGGIHPPLASIAMPDRPDTLKFVMQLDQTGKFRLQFNSSDGEASEETLPFDINVLPDLPPRVEVTKPATSPMPANGFLFLNGKASDDFGLTSARLIFRMRSVAGKQPEVLQPVSMRDRASLTQPDGKVLRQVELKDAIPIESLKDAIGTKVSWAPGMVLEYAFEAEDNFDYPSPQVGRSPWESVTIGDPASQEEKNKAQAAADQVKKEQEQQQQPQPKDDKQDNKGQGDNQPKDQQPDGKDGKDGNQGQGDKQQPKDQPQDGEQGSKDQDNKGQGDRQQPKDQPQNGKDDQGKGDQNQQNKPDQKPANDAGKGEQQQGDQKGDQQQKGQQPLTPEDKKTLEAAKKLEDALREEQKNKSPSEKREGGDQPNDPNAQPKPDGQKDKEQPKDGAKDKQEPQAGKPGDQKDKPEQGKGDKQDSKGQGQERKDGDKTDKEGKKPGTGEPNKSNDQDPKTSPDKGKEDGGKGSSERGGENKAGDKADKPDQKGQSGQSDPKAKPKDDGKPDAGKSDGGKPGDDKGKTEPGSGAQDAKLDNRKPDQPGNKEPAPNDMKGGDNKSDAKSEDKGSQQGKPGEKNGKEGKADGNSKEGGSEVASAPEQYKHADAKQQKDITDKLQDQAKNAPTQEGRDAAKEALEKIDKIRAEQFGKGQADNKSKDQAQPKDKADQGKGEKPDTKPGEQQTGEGPAKPKDGTKPDNKAQPGEQPQDKGDQKDKTEGKQPKQGDQPNNPTQPGSGQPGGNNTPGDVSSTSGEGIDAANPDYKQRAGELQLDNFRNMVDRKVLDRAKMSDQEYQDFLKAYEKLVQKHKEMGPQPGDRARGDAKGSSAANSGAKKVDAQAGGPKVDRTGRGQAPADIRDQYRDFTEQQSKQK